MAADQAHLISFAQKILDQSGPTKFNGYDKTQSDGKVLALSDGTQAVKTLATGASGLVVLDHTPFYAEGGGQAGDHGILKIGKSEIRVGDCTKQNDIFLHHVTVISGSISVGDSVHSEVQSNDRRNTAANHSATHLLHSALRKVLGTHVTQAGQSVDSQKIRFDFTHGKALTAAELYQIEELVNQEISKAEVVSADVMKHKDAIASGAMALFGEKYGDEVRVLKMGDFSTELCGGTHVKNTAQIRVFKITSENGVSSGVRRIEALAGDMAVQFLKVGLEDSLEARRAAGLDLSWEKILNREAGSMLDFVEKKKDEIRTLEKEIKKNQGNQVNVDDMVKKAVEFKSKSGSSKLVFAGLEINDRDVLATVTDHLKNKIPSGIVILVGQGDTTHPIIVSVSKDLNPEVSAGTLLKEIAQIMGGKGGGRPDFAQGAAPDRSKLGEAEKYAVLFSEKLRQ